MNFYHKENSDEKVIQKTKDKLEKYHYNAYRNLVATCFFLNAAGITAVVASLALKFGEVEKHEEILIKHYLTLPSSSNAFFEALNNSLHWFLVSILFMVTCVFVEYISYFPRRKCVTSHSNTNSNCCFCKFLIGLSTVIMFLTLIFSFSFLIYAGFLFKNAPI